MKSFKLKIFMVILLLPSIGWSANEVQIAYAVGSNLYYRIFNSTGEVWNTAGTPAFEAWADGNVTDYDIALTGTGGSFYLGTFPDLSNGTYSVVAYLRAGGAPAVSDGVISSGFMEWRNSAEVGWAALIDLIDTIISTLLDVAMPVTRAARQP